MFTLHRVFEGCFTYVREHYKSKSYNSKMSLKVISDMSIEETNWNLLV